MTQSWKLTLPCTKADAEAIALLDPDMLGLDPPPVLMTREPDESRPDEWLLEAYFEDKPSDEAAELISNLSSSSDAPAIEGLDDADWVTMSQSGLEPVIAGRFFVKTPNDPSEPPPGTTPFIIDAGRAFGTGHHETTSGCLEMIDRIAAAGTSVTRLIDLGTGTGLLAYAGLAIWPEAKAIATDIDPVAIEVAADNAAVNGVELGDGPGLCALIVADGAHHPGIAASAPYDLVIANILAGPLIEMAGDFAPLVKDGGHLVLAGLLTTQADDVIAAYTAHGLTLTDRIDSGDWAILGMRRN